MTCELDPGLNQILSVAIPRPLDGLFTYLISRELAQKVRVGGVVQVPFGRSLTYAFVVKPPQELAELSPELKIDQLKSVVQVDESTPVIPQDVLQLGQWAHEYYAAPLGEVYRCATPLHTAAIRKLKKSARPLKKESWEPEKKHLTQDQAQAVELLEALRQEKPSQVALLQGVTGSGKTEVYIELARSTLNEGKGVIVLVPEIALTPQLHERFEKSLGQRVGLWHSAMSSAKRRDLYQALSRGELNVVVGARSAVFAPVQNLGFIVVDEEHDATYKQDDRVRYHARDLAVVRGKLTQAFVLLGSATPSLETRERVFESKYHLARLPKRIASGGLPRVELVDLCTEEVVEGTQAVLARKTLDLLQKTLDAGEQAMVYLNRRGFAACLICQDCRKVSECPECSISLTVHKFHSELRCHLCGFREPIPLSCSGCQGLDLFPMGAGTESLEMDLPNLLRGARVSRLDRDQITSTTRLTEVLEEFRRGESNLLLGTQMLVKGHDFPRVTLVVVVLADSLFRWPDFRAPERAFQILQQVAGRAGRGDLPGKVLIQTYAPDHPVLGVLTAQMTEELFLEQERELRQVLGYPPFGRLARFRFEGADQKEVMQGSQEFAQELRSWLTQCGTEGAEILGPSEAFLERLKGVYRWDLLIKAKDIQVLQRIIRYSKYNASRQKRHLVIDVDPYGV